MAADNHVRPPVEPLTEADARHLLAEGLLRPCQDHGPTRVALKIGCDEKTVRKARDKDTTLRLDYSWNTLLANSGALDALARHFGFKLVPIDAANKDWLSLAERAANFAAKVIHYQATNGHIDHTEDADLVRDARELAAEATVG